MNWKKLSQEEISERIFNALDQNVNFDEESIIGVPASHLDDKVFYKDNNILKNAPFLSTMVQNPNHIGIHTVGSSESFFAGTQKIEKELIEICAKDILKGDGEFDGYVASGGTEANMQAIWVYKNYFINEHKADINEIQIITSSDRHYSMDKASNILNIDIKIISVNKETRLIEKSEFDKQIKDSINTGKKYFIVVSNMMTTMFGSVDDIDVYTEVLKNNNCEFKLHIDGAYGGFYYPFANEESKENFLNPYVDSVTLDAHKMAQAPYGTGIFIIRKGLINYATTSAASYVEGQDSTLIGSRSGANAIAVWMILSKHGPFGWHEKVFILQKRTEWVCKQLDQKDIEYYRNPFSNIVTMKAKHISKEAQEIFGLVPDNHHDPKWYKIVVMDHVTIEKLMPLIDMLR